MTGITRKLAALALTGISLALAVACADTVDLGQEQGPGEPDAPVFVVPADSGDAADALAPSFACVGTECPAPYATCAEGPSFKCGQNLLTDPENCGACGASCVGFQPRHMSASCANGTCAYECLTVPDDQGVNHVFKDCDGRLENGCEIDVTIDPANCGACGHACAAGVECLMGKCGCPDGKVDCYGHCRDLRIEDGNCGACGNACPYNPVDGCSPRPPHTGYGCADSQCGVLKCYPGYLDCNGDLKNGCSSDGCEVNILGANPDNCGACGVKCGAGQECRNDGFGFQCLTTCEIAGLTRCGSSCRDLLSDHGNCGACSNFCPNPHANQTSACQKGLCETECVLGFADCNGDPSDGCEVDLRVHPANCGACGHACDFGAGQPCIDGKCLMVECEAGPPR
jgi:hypothetical protein